MTNCTDAPPTTGADPEFPVGGAWIRLWGAWTSDTGTFW